MKLSKKVSRYVNAKKYIWTLVFSTACLIVFAFKPVPFAETTKNLSPENWMVVLIHGTFGSLLGFLSTSDVLQDKVSGTLYRSTTKGMRDDDYFFKDQPILQRGLSSIEPTYSLKQVAGKKYAAYPIAKAYETLQNIIKPNEESLHFYTFGWSGLMSQKSRQFESIRLYNALNEEFERHKSNNKTMKIRIIGHSHGGNLALNLAAVRKALKFIGSQDHISYSQDPDENDSIKKMVALLKTLPNKEIAKTKTGQKVYDYVPTNPSLNVDELIMYGTPIQPETECFSTSDTFKRVFNFYSEGDIVQRMDWVTSKKTLSSQRLSPFPLLKKARTPGMDHIIQARLMSDKPIVNDKIQMSKQKVDQKSTTTSEPTVLQELFSGKNIFIRQTTDPTHKELWFMSWRNEKSAFSPFLSPLPVFILTPLFVHLIEKTNHSADVDINTMANPTELTIYLANYQEGAVKGRMSIPRSHINTIQQSINDWRPDDVSTQADFNATYKHLWK
jgi:hypothetical protein